MDIDSVFLSIKSEAKEAQSRYPAFNSPHEGLAVIQEEFEELKAEVFKNHNSRRTDLMRNEAKQLAAMAVRFMAELT